MRCLEQVCGGGDGKGLRSMGGNGEKLGRKQKGGGEGKGREHGIKC